MLKIIKHEHNKNINELDGYDIEFECENCGCTTLVRVSKRIASSSNLTGEIDSNFNILFEGEEFDYSSVEEYFACVECNNIIFSGSEHEFAEYLKEEFMKTLERQCFTGEESLRNSKL
jgi:hypothetical protein